MQAIAEMAERRMKVLVVITEDWFALSHFVPLLSELKALAAEVVVATRSTGRLREIERLGVRAQPFDMRRGSLNVAVLKRVRDGLARLIDEERPDVVHAIAMQPMVMTSLALAQSVHRPPTVILHLTGQGYLGHSRSPIAHLLRPLALAALRRCTMSCNAWLVAENGDDVARMVADRAAVEERTAIVPGAGVDLARYPQQPAPRNAVVRTAFVGRMLRSKGLYVLVDAHSRLRARGMAIDLALYGDADAGSRDAIPQTTLARWSREPGIAWRGRAGDIVEVWRAADIAVVPALGGDGMPRAMLEAAACGRPLVVSDVPGCREFVRPGVEGLIVPPRDPGALAEALARLAGDPELRVQAGAAARRRVLLYAEAAVRAKIRDIYRAAGAAVRRPFEQGHPAA
jgi:glycosyltransferase involved in cell wall biosynthesis